MPSSTWGDGMGAANAAVVSGGLEEVVKPGLCIHMAWAMWRPACNAAELSSTCVAHLIK